jgi:signal transduction histidine kinase
VWVVDGVQRRQSWWDGLLTMTAVDAVSAVIYGGVLLAHIPTAARVEAGWHTVVSVVLVLLLFAVDRAESLWFPVGTTRRRVAISLLAMRLTLMGVVVQLDASTLAWFLLLIPPVRASLYFGNRVSYVVAAITWVVFFLKHWASDADTPNGLQDVVLFGMALVFVCTIARALREERVSREHTEELLAELARSHTQLQAHAATVAELATTEERNRLARDIHDSLGHYLTVTNVQIAKALAFQYRDPTIAEQAMRHAKDTAHAALRGVRQSVGALRTTRDTFVFASALTALVERMRTDGCEIAVHVEGNEALFSSETLTALYYVTQEGLTNIQKHARATDVVIDVSFSESEGSLTIRDNGRGFLVAATEDTERVADSGYGLHTMRERLTRVGGRLIIASNPGEGTTLTAFAPRSLVTASNGVSTAVKA